MISVTKGDRVVVQDMLKGGERNASVMAAIDDVIITADDTFFIQRFDGEGWNPARTRRIVAKS
jgi:hypothetical protein